MEGTERNPWLISFTPPAWLDGKSMRRLELHPGRRQVRASSNNHLEGKAEVAPFAVF
jgi:hypothetical protein